MQRFFLFLIVAFSVSSCSSSDKKEASAVPERSGAKISTINKGTFGYKDEDIARGDDGSITGGKRSQFDKKTSSAYASGKKTPSYMKKEYLKKTWGGDKSFSTGSYQTKGFRGAKKSSRFGNRKSNEANKIARGSGRSYDTGSFRTGSANEVGRSVRTNSSGYINSRNNGGIWRENIFKQGDQGFRDISMGEAKSLLR